MPCRRTLAAGFLPCAHSGQTSLRLPGCARFPTPLDWQGRPLAQSMVRKPVRTSFTCDPYHAVSRGWASPSLSSPLHCAAANRAQIRPWLRRRGLPSWFDERRERFEAGEANEVDQTICSIASFGFSPVEIRISMQTIMAQEAVICIPLCLSENRCPYPRSCLNVRKNSSTIHRSRFISTMTSAGMSSRFATSRRTPSHVGPCMFRQPACGLSVTRMSRIGWSGSMRCRDFQPRSTISSLITLAARSASDSSLVCLTGAAVLSEAL